ncbi:lantibiotic dehydratase [Streptomyces varsoviensis]|uniref:lantibiotic dehydratase n=1 Tax=Streptomyces varsoviensis TaxID=67373 RepID=UPI0034114D0C
MPHETPYGTAYGTTRNLPYEKAVRDDDAAPPYETPYGTTTQHPPYETPYGTTEHETRERAMRTTDPRPAAAESAPPWALGERFMVRVAGLPVESVRALRTPDTRRWADEVCAAEARLAGRAEDISDRLYEVISANTDDGLRRALVNIRRQVFNNKLPRDPAAALGAAEAVGGETGARLAAWLRDRRALADLVRSGPAILAAELAGGRERLRELAVEPRLRQGLVLASPSLDRYLGTYLGAGAAALTKRQRRIERSLLEYVYRTACKTSPFSTFTGLALGEFRDGDGSGAFGGRIDAEWSDHPRLNVAVIGRLADLVVGNDAHRADLPVTLVTGWRVEADRIRYVRRKVTAGDDEATVSFDAVKESLFYLKQGGSLERLFTLFGQRPAIRYGDLVAELSANGEAPAADYDRFLSVLLRLGLLQVPGLSVTNQSPDPLGGFRDAVRGLGTDWGRRLADRLGGPAALLDRYPHAGLDERRRLLTELREELGAVQEELGASGPSLPKTLVYEDSRAAAAPLVWERRGWEKTVGESLRTLSRVLPVFDVTLPQRLLLKAFFLARFGPGGRCDDVLKLVHDFHEDIFDQYARISAQRRPFDDAGDYVELDNWLDSPGITAIDRARRELVARMRELWNTREPGAEELVLDDASLAAVADELAPAQAGFQPLSHFLQPARRDGADLAVLNRSWGGVGFPFSRFTHCFEDAPDSSDTDGGGLAGRVRRDLRAAQPSGAVFAEVTGGHATTNLNLHGRLTDYEVVCPGETSSAPPAEQLPLDDLYVVHDAAENRLVLRSERLDREVVPVYLGYLVAMALPDVPRALLLLSPAAVPAVDFWGGVPEEEAATEKAVTTRPRVRYGGVVVSRRSWSAPAAALPARTPETSDAEWYLAWQRWRQRHGVPAQVFATVRAPAAEEGEEGGGPGPLAGDKPQYVDFDSYLSLTVFETRLKEAGARVVLREALPGEEDARVTSPDGRHVAEMVVETRTAQRRPETADPAEAPVLQMTAEEPAARVKDQVS